MLFQSNLCSATEVTTLLRTVQLHHVVVNSQMRLDVCWSLASVLTELAAEWFLSGVSVLDVAGEGGGGGAGHVTVRTLVVVHMTPHVVSQVSLYGKLLLTSCAGKAVTFLLLETMIHELDSVGEQSSTSWTPNKTFLTVTSQMFF